MRAQRVAANVAAGAFLFGLGLMTGAGVIWQPATAQSPYEHNTAKNECVLRNASKIQNVGSASSVGMGPLEWLNAACNSNPRLGR